MPNTWKLWSKDVLGYTPVMTDTNERYVAMTKIQRWKEQGYSNSDISRIWNQGHAGKCIRGINSKGIAYNSCDYEKKVVSLLTNIKN